MLAFHFSHIALLMAEEGFEWSALTFPAMWFGALILAIVMESATTELVAIWFAPGAFIAMILAFLEVDLVVQVVTFVAVTVLCLVLTRTVFRKVFIKRNPAVKMNTSALIGRTALVEEDIDNYAARGVVKINGQLWTARMATETDHPKKGDWVEIVAVEGAKLICRSKD